MARMHSRKKGKAGSTKPAKKAKPRWIRHTKKEVELLITKYARAGTKPSQIGLILRDRYGVPDVKPIIGSRINQFLESKKLGLEMPEDLLSLIKRAVMIRKHLVENHKDQTAKRGLQLTESKIRRLVHYYKLNGKLPIEWKYDEKTVEMFA